MKFQGPLSRNDGGRFAAPGDSHGLSCGQGIEILLRGQWIPARVELFGDSRRWYAAVRQEKEWREEAQEEAAVLLGPGLIVRYEI